MRGRERERREREERREERREREEGKRRRERGERRMAKYLIESRYTISIEWQPGFQYPSCQKSSSSTERTPSRDLLSLPG
jgi:hypothetical protein